WRAVMPRRENWMVIHSLLIPYSVAEEARVRTRARALDLIPLVDLDRSRGQDLNRRGPEVVCPWRPFARTGAHCLSSGATARRVAEAMAKSPREMGVVAKAAGIRDLAQGLACRQRRAAIEQARGMIETKRIDEFAARRAARHEQLLEVPQRDP